MIGAEMGVMAKEQPGCGWLKVWYEQCPGV